MPRITDPIYSNVCVQHLQLITDSLINVCVTVSVKAQRDGVDPYDISKAVTVLALLRVHRCNLLVRVIIPNQQYMYRRGL